MRALCLALVLCATSVSAEEVLPPGQPASGPGGSDYSHGGFTVVEGGRGDEAWRAFLPADPVPERAPVVVFVHGWAALSTDGYAAWIEHLARRGNLVICPRYQATLLTLPSRMTDAAHAAVREALVRLEREGPVRPDRDRAGVLGHSMGGVIAANLAGRGGRAGRPRFSAVVCVQPGDAGSWLGAGGAMLEDPGRIPAGTLLLTIAGDRDTLVGDRLARRIFAEAVQVAPEDRSFVLVRSDAHGSIPLLADHYSPMAARARGNARRSALPRVAAVFSWALTGEARGRVLDVISPDALDWLGYWKLADGLFDAAFQGKNRAYALGCGPEQRDMGRWSDGTRVRRLQPCEER